MVSTGQASTQGVAWVLPGPSVPQIGARTWNFLQDPVGVRSASKWFPDKLAQGRRASLPTSEAQSSEASVGFPPGKKSKTSPRCFRCSERGGSGPRNVWKAAVCANLRVEFARNVPGTAEGLLDSGGAPEPSGDHGQPRTAAAGAGPPSTGPGAARRRWSWKGAEVPARAGHGPLVTQQKATDARLVPGLPSLGERCLRASAHGHGVCPAHRLAGCGWNRVPSNPHALYLRWWPWGPGRLIRGDEDLGMAPSRSP